jgi:hypothetical protein
MGYTTDFIGAVEIHPPLNAAEIEYLTRFANTRRMQLKEGPYFVGQGGFMGQDEGPNVIDYNEHADGQPGLWCQWVPVDGGRALAWNGTEKFYDSDQWMAYLIDHFLRPGAKAAKSGEAQFKDFSFDHACSGLIVASGEAFPDLWKLVVIENRVRTMRYELELDWIEGWDEMMNAARGNPPAAIEWVEESLSGEQRQLLAPFLADLARGLPEPERTRLVGLARGPAAMH